MSKFPSLHKPALQRIAKRSEKLGEEEHTSPKSEKKDASPEKSFSPPTERSKKLVQSDSGKSVVNGNVSNLSPPVSWLSGNAFVSGAGGLRFKSRAAKSYTVLPTVRHRCNISSKEAALPGCNDEEMDPASSLHVSA